LKGNSGAKGLITRKQPSNFPLTFYRIYSFYKFPNQILCTTLSYIFMKNKQLTPVLHCTLLYCTYINKLEGRTHVLPAARTTGLRDCIYVTHCSHVRCTVLGFSAYESDSARPSCVVVIALY